MTRKRQELVYARRLRRNQTHVESLLWRQLRRRELGGIKFRRQHPIGGFVVDFYCDAAELGVELDGGGHASPEQRA